MRCGRSGAAPPGGACAPPVSQAGRLRAFPTRDIRRSSSRASRCRRHHRERVRTRSWPSAGDGAGTSTSSTASARVCRSASRAAPSMCPSIRSARRKVGRPGRRRAQLAALEAPARTSDTATVPHGANLREPQALARIGSADLRNESLVEALKGWRRGRRHRGRSQRATTPSGTSLGARALRPRPPRCRRAACGRSAPAGRVEVEAARSDNRGSGSGRAHPPVVGCRTSCRSE